MTFRHFVEILTELVTDATFIIIFLTLLFFFWNGVRFIVRGGDAKWREDARPALVWGIVVLFVMFTLWAIVRLLSATFFST